jgi:hypothetical protein
VEEEVRGGASKKMSGLLDSDDDEVESGDIHRGWVDVSGFMASSMLLG